MARDPVRQGLGPGRLRIGIVRGPERGDEQLRRAHLAGLGVDHVDRVPRVIDEQPLARRVALAHHRRQLAFPPRVKLAEPGVAIALRVTRAIFLPQQRQRHALAAQLAVDIRPVRLGRTVRDIARCSRIDQSLEVGVGQIFWQWPSQRGITSAIQIALKSGAPNRQARRNFTGRQTLG